MPINEYTLVSRNQLGGTGVGRTLSKTKGLAFYVSLLFLCCFFHSQSAAVHAQEYELSDDEFFITLPGKPDKDRTFSSTYEAYRVTANNVDYLVLLRNKRQSARKGYEYQLLSVKGHSIGYNAGFIRESKRDGVNVDIIFDRDFKLSGFPARQYRIVSNAGPGVLRFYATDRCTYTLQVLGATDKDHQVKAFFDSFKLRRGDANR